MLRDIVRYLEGCERTEAAELVETCRKRFQSQRPPQVFVRFSLRHLVREQSGSDQSLAAHSDRSADDTLFEFGCHQDVIDAPANVSLTNTLR